jgi:dTDP-4-dehydrorhamnose 3,5-epimerase-like enzyme
VRKKTTGNVNSGRGREPGERGTQPRKGTYNRDVPLRIEPLTEHADPRGSLLKLHPAPVEGEVYAVTAVPGASRGHHLHRAMGEWFVAVSGQGSVGAVDPDSGEVHHVDLRGVRVYVPAGWAHALFATGEEPLIAIAMAERLHDPDDVFAQRVPAP